MAQVRLYAQRRLADALTHEAGTELESAQLATLKALFMEQVSSAFFMPVPLGV